MLNLVANGPSGYNLNNSLRIRGNATAYLNKTFGSGGSQTTWTWSAWVKRGTLGGTYNELFGVTNGGSDATFLVLCFGANGVADTLGFQGWATNYRTTTQVFRDPSAWYHIVLAVDTTQATASNRIRLYVNGSEITAFQLNNNPAQNATLLINSATTHNMGRDTQQSSNFDGYITEVNFVNGQQLTPSSFGSTNATTGVWQPAKYTGTYGTNGFYLNFSNIALTSGSNTGLGQDFSGNGNYWNTNNISVTAGTTYDAMTDVPTLTSATVANYCVLNPLAKTTGSGNYPINANLEWYSAVANWLTIFASIGVSSGKFYWEITNSNLTSSSTYTSIGISSAVSPNALGSNIGSDAASYAYYSQNGQKYNNGTATAYGSAYVSNDVVGVALDLNNGKLYFSKNGTWQNSGDPVAGTNAAYTGLSGTFVPAISEYGSIIDANFGQRPFTYTPPTGFVALNTFNLPTSTIVQGNKYMDATLYTGNGSTQSITNTAGFKPDLVWIKSRSAATDHKLTDSNRGATKALISDSTAAETTDTNGVTAFTSTGFTLGTDTNYNNNTATYVGWQWQAGQGSSSSNTNGSITSTVSVNATAGFSVVTWASASGTNTVGHGLGVAPKMIIAKNRSIVSNWPIYHTSIGGANILLLDTTNASAANTTWFNGTAPTSTVFSTSTGFGNGNYCVAYCFAEIAGFSKFGSYTGNGSADGPFVYCGFRPKFVLIKRSDGSTEQWDINDTSRDPYNAAQYYLAPNSSIAEVSVNPTMDILSNGFKIRYNGGPWNSSGGTYIYMAFAENPTKFSLAR